MNSHPLSSPAFILLCCLAIGWQSAIADELLRDVIDRRVGDALKLSNQPSAPPATDAEFLRRVSLDLAGRIPAADQARAFLDDSAPDKRGKLVDRLLQSPEHARHLQYVFDQMLMRRLRAKHVKADEWRDYLYESFREQKPWDQLTRELLSADGAVKADRPAARFLLDRELKTEETVRDIGRVFLGRDLQCAQCHDHPHFGDYLQRHYYGISAFLSRSYLFRDPKSKQTSIGEKAEGDVKFTSVFTDQEDATAPRILDRSAIGDPPKEESPYLVKPDKKSRGVPRYSRRRQLAWEIIDPGNRAFRLNIANRLWAMMMGRGLVDPVDMFHEDNPPSHPKLLDTLADDLHDHCYQLRRTLREIALSQTYQQSSHSDGEAPSPEQYAAGAIKPLSPEQLAWSVMQATGVAGAAQESAEAKLQKEHPDLAPDSIDFAFRLEQATTDALQKHVDEFVSEFASTAESSQFDATARQALFLKNGGRLTQWLQPGGDNLIARLQKLDNKEVADEAYLSVMTRRPSPEERESVKQFLDSFGDHRLLALQELTRAMLCSAEFRLNH